MDKMKLKNRSMEYRPFSANLVFVIGVIGGFCYFISLMIDRNIVDPVHAIVLPLVISPFAVIMGHISINNIT